MKLIVLMENTAARDDLSCEHGLSLYIEAAGLRILFDAGQTTAFADNAEKLGVDLRAVDLCILSHGHYDHGGGLQRFLEINDRAPVYLSRHAFGAHYNGTAKYIGLPEALQASDRLVFTGDEAAPAPGLTLHSCNHCAFPILPYGLTVRQNGTFRPEDFRHEQYLLIEAGGRRILVSGCSHKGVVNLARHFRPDVLIGGFHLMKLDPANDAAALERTADALLSLPMTCYTGHCTGAEQYTALKARMGDRLHALSTGAVYEI